MSGLIKRGSTYHISKTVKVGNKKSVLRESTGTGDLAMAETILRKRIGEVEHILLYGVQRKRTFSEGAAKLLEIQNDRNTIWHLDILMPYIGDAYLDELYFSEYGGSPGLVAFVDDRKKTVSNITVNRSLEIVRKIIVLSATKWREENKPWISMPMFNVRGGSVIEMLEEDDAPPYPISFGQQRNLFSKLAYHISIPALFCVNTGLRDENLCYLRWEWERRIPKLGVSVFDIPTTKNDRPHRVVLNSIAREIIEAVRGDHPEYVFTYRGKPMTRLNNTAWQNGVDKAGLRDVRGPGAHLRIHDLRHTFSTRLRECGVSKEDRSDHLGHKNQDITTHYSTAETGKLLGYVERLVTMESDKPSIYVVREAM